MKNVFIFYCASELVLTKTELAQVQKFHLYKTMSLSFKKTCLVAVIPQLHLNHTTISTSCVVCWTGRAQYKKSHSQERDAVAVSIPVRALIHPCLHSVNSIF